jgi:hypothetical protein
LFSDEWEGTVRGVEDDDEEEDDDTDDALTDDGGEGMMRVTEEEEDMVGDDAEAGAAIGLGDVNGTEEEDSFGLKYAGIRFAHFNDLWREKCFRYSRSSI